MRTTEEAAVFVYMLLFVILGNLVLRRLNPKPQHYFRKGGGWPYVAFWNAFDSSKFTDEGIRYNKRTFEMILPAAAIFYVGLWIVKSVW